MADPVDFEDDGYSKELATANNLRQYLSTCLAAIDPPPIVSCKVNQNSRTAQIECNVLVANQVFDDTQALLESEVRFLSRSEDENPPRISYEAVIPAIANHDDQVSQIFHVVMARSELQEDPIPTILSMPSNTEADPNFGRPAASIEHVILLIHGIRDIGAWQNKVSRNLSQVGTVVEQIRYGYYPEVRFLFPLDLSYGPVNKILKRIRALKNQYPNAKMSVVAHSFGTYVFLKALKQDSDLEFWKVIFCGSVADDQFEWSELKRRVGDRKRATKDFVLNDCGTGDAWPILGTAFGWHYGMAGATGFSEGFVTNRFHRSIGGQKGGHGLYFDPEFVVRNWRPFLIDDVAPSHGDGAQGEHLSWPIRLMYHGWMRICCKLLALGVWLSLFALFGYCSLLLYNWLFYLFFPDPSTVS